MFAFVPVQYTHAPARQYWGPEPDASSYYQQLAAQHQRQAELALARARQARLQALQRQQIAEQNAYVASLYAQAFEHPSVSRRPYVFSEPEYSFSPIDFFTPRQRRVDATLEAMKWRRTQEAKLRLQREQELRKAREQAFEPWFESAIVGLAGDPETEPSLQRRKAVRFSPIARPVALRPQGRALTRESVARSEPSPTTMSRANSSPAQTRKDKTKTHTERAEKFAVELWNALSSNRSDEEKEAILKAFGLPKPASAGERLPEAVATPSSSEPIPVNIAPSVPEPAQDSSATTEEQERTKLLYAISALEKKFDSLTSSFEFPAHIDFDATSDVSDSHSVSSLASDAPSVSYTSANKSLHAYENSLNSLLTKLDEVESHGFDEVRSNRKRLVRAIEAELESLDNKKVEMWLKQQEKEKSERLGDKVHIEWEPENIERPTTPALPSVENVVATETEVEVPKAQDTSEPVILDKNEIEPLAMEVDNAGTEALQSQESPDPTTVPLPDTDDAHQIANNESGHISQSAAQVEGADIPAPDTPLHTDAQGSVPSESTSYAASGDSRASTPTKRRSVTIEEVVDEDFEML